MFWKLKRDAGSTIGGVGSNWLLGNLKTCLGLTQFVCKELVSLNPRFLFKSKLDLRPRLTDTLRHFGSSKGLVSQEKKRLVLTVE